jgi:hypothetical protein
MSKSQLWRKFVHLAYIDDSDTKSKTRAWQVVAGVIIEDKAFTCLDCVMGTIRDDLVSLIPPGNVFEEFHAAELYGGYGAFQGVDQDRRFEAIQKLLVCLQLANLSVVYGAVNIAALRAQLYASADPMDICFRICLTGIKSWLDERISGDQSLSTDEMISHMTTAWLQELVILVVDDCESKIKASLLKSFRSQRLGPATSPANQLRHFHDDMYFGDSKYSIGIQLADLCAYFLARHLEGDLEIQCFYEMVSPHIVFSQVHPNVPEAFDPLPEADEKSDEAKL